MREQLEANMEKQVAVRRQLKSTQEEESHVRNRLDACNREIQFLTETMVCRWDLRR